MGWHAFVCPSCHKEGSVPAEAIGKSAKCAKCEAVIDVPSAEQDAFFRQKLRELQQSAAEEKRRQQEAKREHKKEEQERKKQEREKAAARRAADEELQRQAVARAVARRERQDQEYAERQRQAEAERANPEARLKEAGNNVEWGFTAIGVVLIVMGVIFVCVGLAAAHAASDRYMSGIQAGSGAQLAWAPPIIKAVFAFCAGGLVIALGRFVSALGDTIAAIAISAAGREQVQEAPSQREGWKPAEMNSDIKDIFKKQ